MRGRLLPHLAAGCALRLGLKGRRLRTTGCPVDPSDFPFDELAEPVRDRPPPAVREEYVYAIELARGLHDPTHDWEAFRDTLWRYLLRVFGMPVDHDHS